MFPEPCPVVANVYKGDTKQVLQSAGVRIGNLKRNHPVENKGCFNPR